MKTITNMLNNEKGQGTIEYAMATIVIIAVLVAIIGLGTNNPLQQAISDAFAKVSGKVGAIS